MATAKTAGFRWLPSYYEAVRDLPDRERLAIYDAIADFGFGNEVTELPPLLRGMFGLIKPTLEKSVRFERKQRENGQKGGRPSGRKNPAQTQNNPDETQIEPNSNLGETLPLPLPLPLPLNVEKGTACPSRAPRFSPPSVDEVSAYCEERSNGVDAQGFCDFYDSKGWKVGNSPMKDWKAAVRSWERREREQNAHKQSSGNVFLDLAREEGLAT